MCGYVCALSIPTWTQLREKDSYGEFALVGHGSCTPGLERVSTPMDLSVCHCVCVSVAGHLCHRMNIALCTSVCIIPVDVPELALSWVSLPAASAFIESTFGVCVCVCVVVHSRSDDSKPGSPCVLAPLGTPLLGHSHCLRVIESVCWRGLLTQMERRRSAPEAKLAMTFFFQLYPGQR